MLSKKAAPKKADVKVTSTKEVMPKKKMNEPVKEIVKEEQKVSPQLVKSRRIQTAEGWKRSMLLAKKKVK